MTPTDQATAEHVSVHFIVFDEKDPCHRLLGSSHRASRRLVMDLQRRARASRPPVRDSGPATPAVLRDILASGVVTSRVIASGPTSLASSGPDALPDAVTTRSPSPSRIRESRSQLLASSSITRIVPALAASV